MAEPLESPIIDEVILTEDVLALVRLPIPVNQFGAIAKAFPEAYCTQRGEFLVILRPA